MENGWMDWIEWMWKVNGKWMWIEWMWMWKVESGKWKVDSGAVPDLTLLGHTFVFGDIGLRRKKT